MMIETKERAWQCFEKLRRTLLAQSSHWWRKDFKDHVDKIIKWCIDQKELITSTPRIDEEDEEDARMYLHGLRRLVAGAIQEWELVQQPDHAFICARIDGALVWQGRGYVSQFLHTISSLQPSLQG